MKNSVVIAKIIFCKPRMSWRSAAATQVARVERSNGRKVNL
jgi:hypothetical protein